jgi:hypothetical protein
MSLKPSRLQLHDDCPGNRHQVDAQKPQSFADKLRRDISFLTGRNWVH